MTRKIIEKHYRPGRSKSLRASGKRSYETTKELWESSKEGKKLVALLAMCSVIGISLVLFLPWILDHILVALVIYVVLIAVAVGRRKKKSWKEIKEDAKALYGEE